MTTIPMHSDLCGRSELDDQIAVNSRMLSHLLDRRRRCVVDRGIAAFVGVAAACVFVAALVGGLGIGPNVFDQAWSGFAILFGFVAWQCSGIWLSLVATASEIDRLVALNRQAIDAMHSLD